MILIRLGPFITTNANELTMFANQPLRNGHPTLHIAITPNAPLDAVVILFALILLNSSYRMNPVYDKALITNSLNSFKVLLTVLNFRNSNSIKSAVSGSFFLIGLFNSRLEASTMLLTISASHQSDKSAVL
jgi:hypothetical protein